jgi:RimJ/RimL family protein N-acetyltransferase
MTLERLTPPFAAQYRALMLQAYAEHPDAFTSSAAERAALSLAWWEQRLSAGPDAPEWVLGVIEDDRLLAAVGLSFDVREKAAHKATLFGMYVVPAHRGRGLGRELVLATLDNARAHAGTRLVQLTVTDGNHSAETLYRQCGFVPFGLEPLAVAVNGKFVSKLHMWCDLRAKG